MTLDEAIEKLQDLKRYAYEPETEQAHKALELGSEALKREESWRRLHPHLAVQPLEGETKD